MYLLIGMVNASIAWLFYSYKKKNGMKKTFAKFFGIYSIFFLWLPVVVIDKAYPVDPDRAFGGIPITTLGLSVLMLYFTYSVYKTLNK